MIRIKSMIGGKSPFFRVALKLANGKAFPAFFASLCLRVGHGVEREAVGCFSRWPRWPFWRAFRNFKETTHPGTTAPKLS